MENLNIQGEGQQPNPEAQPSTPELTDHEKEMIKVAQANRGEEVEQVEEDSKGEETSQPEQRSEKPEWLPDHLWDAEKGQPTEEFNKLTEKPEEKPEEKSKEEPEEKSKGDEAPAPLTDLISEASKSYEENGDISEDVANKLMEAGIPQEYIEAYKQGFEAQIALKAAQEEIASMKAYAITGSSEEYNAMLNWASQSLNEQEITAYNEAVSNGETMEKAVKDLYSKYRESQGFEGRQLHGNGATASKGNLIHNRAELMERMGSPEYKTNPQYRKQVEIDIQRSKKAGLNPFS